VSEGKGPHIQALKVVGKGSMEEAITGTRALQKANPSMDL